MERLDSGSRVLALAAALALSACTSWFWPESRSRGHLFDEFTRERAWVDGDFRRAAFESHLRREFPAGTPLAEVLPHIQGAGVTCTETVEDESANGRRTMVCNYESRSYFIGSITALSGHYFSAVDIHWILRVIHANGRVEDYAIKGTEAFHSPTAEDYQNGVYRQREQERQQQQDQEG